jgi:hypothetical protein|tara:strand:- start:375 stop:1052 length:678 start_codon:yes stop_codon:yes gene_type:complete
MDRDTRRIQNTKQTSVEFQGKPSLNGMVEGQIAIEKKSNSQLAIYRKKFGQLWKSYMSNNGDQYVDRTLTANTLKYSHKFIDYRTFIHNFSDNIGTDVILLPWQGTEEQANMDNATSAFLTPYTITCQKILFRPESLAGTTTADITFTIHRQDDGDTNTDTVARFTYTPTLASNTLLTVNESEFNNSPKVEAGSKVGISIAANSDPAGGTIDYYITSVWRVEVEI